MSFFVCVSDCMRMCCELCLFDVCCLVVLTYLSGLHSFGHVLFCVVSVWLSVDRFCVLLLNVLLFMFYVCCVFAFFI